MDFGIVFLNPVVACDAAVKVAMLDITADLLRPDQTDLQFVIIHVRNVRAAADLNVEASFRHLFDCRFLQTAFGQTKAQRALFLSHTPLRAGFRPKMRSEHSEGTSECKRGTLPVLPLCYPTLMRQEF